MNRTSQLLFLGISLSSISANAMGPFVKLQQVAKQEAISIATNPDKVDIASARKKLMTFALSVNQAVNDWSLNKDETKTNKLVVKSVTLMVMSALVSDNGCDSKSGGKASTIDLNKNGKAEVTQGGNVTGLTMVTNCYFALSDLLKEFAMFKGEAN